MPKTLGRAGVRRKTVWLSDEGRAIIQTWADENGVSFSSAIEALARLATKEPAATALAPILAAAVHFRALRKLQAAAAIDAGTAARLAGDAVRLLVQERAATSPKTVTADLKGEDKTPANFLTDERKKKARLDSVKALRKPLDLAGYNDQPQAQTEPKKESD